jgi:hypothetical protein
MRAFSAVSESISAWPARHLLGARAIERRILALFAAHAARACAFFLPLQGNQPRVFSRLNRLAG